METPNKDQASGHTPGKHAPAARDAVKEAAHIHQIVTTRGEGLADLLMMKREFERHTVKVSLFAVFEQLQKLCWFSLTSSSANLSNELKTLRKATLSFET